MTKPQHTHEPERENQPSRTPRKRADDFVTLLAKVRKLPRGQLRRLLLEAAVALDAHRPDGEEDRAALRLLGIGLAADPDDVLLRMDDDDDDDPDNLLGCW